MSDVALSQSHAGVETQEREDHIKTSKSWSMEHHLSIFLLILVFLTISSIDSFQIRSSPCAPRRRFHSSSIRAISNDDGGKVPQIHVSSNNAANISTVFHEVWREDRRNQIQHGDVHKPLIIQCHIEIVL